MTELTGRRTGSWRIAVVGVSCAGKSSLARELSAKLRIPHIEQDELYWLPDWRPVSSEEFRASVAEKILGEEWVVCGNFSETRAEVFERATHVIWLNFSKRVVAARALWRTCGRVFRNRRCCNGNVETFRHAFLSKDSIFYWIAKTYQKRIVEFQAAKPLLEARGVTFLEFRKPSDVARWLESL